MTPSAPASTDELLQQQQDGVLTLTINRPERRNALNAAVIQGLSDALVQARSDRTLRAIVLTAVGERAFCAGADLQTGQSFKFDYSEPQQAFANLMRTARATHVPFIARINGACVAGGMGLLAMCDLAVAASNARFGLPEVKIGVFPAQVLSVLQGLVGRRMLTELCITGELIDAQKALSCGLINSVAEDLDAGVEQLLSRITDKSPVAIRRGLYLMKHIEAMPFEQAMAFTEGQIGLFALTEDAAEGQAAFREKRPPHWSGR